MAAKAQTSAELISQAAKRRALLVESLEETRFKLQPSQLKAVASARIQQMSSHVTDVALAKASSPLGLVATAATAALGVFALPRGRTIDATAARDDALQPPYDGEKALLPALSPLRGGGAGPLLNLALAIGTGIVLHKVIPISAQENDLLGGVGDKLRHVLDDWVETQSTRLVTAPAGESLSMTNLITLAVGLFAARR